MNAYLDTHFDTVGLDTGLHRFTMPAWISRAPYEKLLGMEILKAEAGEAILQMPFVISLAQGAGLMHGGALVSLADTAIVMAIKSIVPPATHFAHFATISMENRFLHPVKQGTVRAMARTAERDGRILKGKCDLLDENDRIVMTFSSTNKIARDAVIRDVRFGDVT
ncbi:PaaI family thioesterase [Desulfosarcina sp. OttesenSCG-928-B08]|nr:PaaI family thioesterase [Desulfosarcina sp. OttesenSCG-928-B08]